jgi:hypothetical protein
VTGLIADEGFLPINRRPSKVAKLGVETLIEEDVVTGDIPVQHKFWNGQKRVRPGAMQFMAICAAGPLTGGSGSGSTDGAGEGTCVSHVYSVLGTCVMMTSALERIETERRRRESLSPCSSAYMALALVCSARLKERNLGLWALAPVCHNNCSPPLKGSPSSLELPFLRIRVQGAPLVRRACSPSISLVASIGLCPVRVLERWAHLNTMPRLGINVYSSRVDVYVLQLDCL